jgi:hypothetical protein
MARSAASDAVSVRRCLAETAKGSDLSVSQARRMLVLALKYGLLNEAA